MKINLLLLLLLFLSCEYGNQDLKEDILSKESFATILKEVHVAETIYDLTKSKNINIAKNTLAIEYTRIYSDHNINKRIFKENLDYYTNHPEDLEKIYSIIIDSLIHGNSIVNP